MTRVYFGCVIFPKNFAGMYSARADGQPLAADTLAGIKKLIRRVVRAERR